MCAIWLSISGTLRSLRLISIGLLVGIAGFFTIKAIFYLPALIIIVATRYVKVHSIIYGLSVLTLLGMIALSSFSILLLAHSLTFETISSPFDFLNRTSGTTLGKGDYSRFAHYALIAIIQNFVPVILVTVGALRVLKKNIEITKRLSILALLSPLMSFFIYRDVYPYFYPFILAPVMVITAIAYDDLVQRLRIFMVSAIIASLIMSGGVVFIKSLSQSAAPQRLTLEVIHTLFDSETFYIDARSMVSSMPKRGIFMSKWGMTDYRSQGQPVMEQILETYSPKFLLTNHPRLDVQNLSPKESQLDPLGLLAEDLSTLKNNYLPFWGPLYIPGKLIKPSKRTFRVLLSGMYRVEATAAFIIDGKTITPNGRIYLSKGIHAITSATTIRLIQDLPTPDIDPPLSPLFGTF